MMQLVLLIIFIALLQLFVEDASFVVFARLAVFLYVWQWFMEMISYIMNFFRIG